MKGTGPRDRVSVAVELRHAKKERQGVARLVLYYLSTAAAHRTGTVHAGTPFQNRTPCSHGKKAFTNNNVARYDGLAPVCRHRTHLGTLHIRVLPDAAVGEVLVGAKGTDRQVGPVQPIATPGVATTRHRRIAPRVPVVDVCQEMEVAPGIAEDGRVFGLWRGDRQRLDRRVGPWQTNHT